MADSPAFQFYVNDFLGSAKVGVMTTEEIGAYTMLLILDWQEGGFAFDAKKLARWCRLSTARFNRAWEAIAPCFVPDESGRLFNPRLQRERAKQAEWRAKSSRGGKKGAAARWGGDDEPDRGGDKGGHQMATTNESPSDDTPSPSPSPVTTTATTPDRQRRDPRDGRKNWVTAVTESWVRQVGGVTFGRVGKALEDAHRLHGLPALLAAVDNFAKHRKLAVTAGKNPDRFAQFVEDLTDYIPPHLVGQGEARGAA